ncbi:uncharacterized protein RCC_09935 [Ramularia collo-cygni]|uniref:Uncharacterized protein n=1 Tax=Ramularia collo-cygni TaxID=112498 RepID=A0A2D3V1L3_9PEZI|nr:uncharacterized protein RCC_09935 [Ramularia collo-cygni]CZT24217.1 uncharacterized protein RCC_09935 [Ramularia collo-cygni]
MASKNDTTGMSMLAYVACMSEAERMQFAAKQVQPQPPPIAAAPPPKPPAVHQMPYTIRALFEPPGVLIESWRISLSEQPPGYEVAAFPITHDMPFYTGSLIVTQQVRDITDFLHADHLYTATLKPRKKLNKQTKARLVQNFPAIFTARGTMTFRNPLLRYFHDLRLFTRLQWIMLTRGDERLEAELQWVGGHCVVAWKAITKEASTAQSAGDAEDGIS